LSSADCAPNGPRAHNFPNTILRVIIDDHDGILALDQIDPFVLRIFIFLSCPINEYRIQMRMMRMTSGKYTPLAYTTFSDRFRSKRLYSTQSDQSRYQKITSIREKDPYFRFDHQDCRFMQTLGVSSIQSDLPDSSLTSIKSIIDSEYTAKPLMDQLVVQI
jgi:hypothetical protein